MHEGIFSSSELEWLSANREIADSIYETLEESLNTNSLNDGNQDLEPYKIAVKAAQITIEAAKKELITGPYDTSHYQIICSHLDAFPWLSKKEKTFWELFSFHRACFAEEFENCSDARIYMEAMREMIRTINEDSSELELYANPGNMMAGFNTNTIKKMNEPGKSPK